MVWQNQHEYVAMAEQVFPIGVMVFCWDLEHSVNMRYVQALNYFFNPRPPDV